MSRVLRLAFAFLLLAHPAFAGEEALKSGTFDPPRQAPAFTLHGSNGTPLSLEAFHGKVVVLGFGFSRCHTVCPITLANLSRMQRALGEAGGGVQVLYLTVDPERDTPERMHDFLARYHPAFLGGTGTPAEMKAVHDAYGIVTTKVYPETKGTLDYEVHHSSFLYLIDRQGRLRALVPFGKPPEDIAHDVRILLRDG